MVNSQAIKSKEMVKVFWYGLMDRDMKDSGRIISKRDMEDILILIRMNLIVYMKDFGFMINIMVMVLNNGKMGIFIKANTKILKNTGMEYFNGPMEVLTKEAF